MKRRAKTLAQTAEISQQNLVNSLKQKKAALELRLDNLTDLAPESTDSLRPGSADWSADKWVLEVQQVKQDIYATEIQLKLAKETYDEFFTDIEEK